MKGFHSVPVQPLVADMETCKQDVDGIQQSGCRDYVAAGRGRTMSKQEILLLDTLGQTCRTGKIRWCWCCLSQHLTLDQKMCVAYTCPHTGQNCFVLFSLHITSDKADQLLHNAQSWMSSLESTQAEETPVHPCSHGVHCVSVNVVSTHLGRSSCCPVWPGCPRGLVQGLLSPLNTTFSLDSNTSRVWTPNPPPVCDRDLLCDLSNNISCRASVLLPAAPYPTTKHRFVSMLLYASIQWHCIVPVTHTKTDESEYQPQLVLQVLNLSVRSLATNRHWLLVQ